MSSGASLPERLTDRQPRCNCLSASCLRRTTRALGVGSSLCLTRSADPPSCRNQDRVRPKDFPPPDPARFCWPLRVRVWPGLRRGRPNEDDSTPTGVACFGLIDRRAQSHARCFAVSDRRAQDHGCCANTWTYYSKCQPRPVRRDGFAKPGAPHPLLAAEGALIQHDSPFPSLFLPDQDTPIVIRE